MNIKAVVLKRRTNTHASKTTEVINNDPHKMVIGKW